MCRPALYKKLLNEEDEVDESLTSSLEDDMPQLIPIRNLSFDSLPPLLSRGGDDEDSMSSVNDNEPPPLEFLPSRQTILIRGEGAHSLQALDAPVSRGSMTHTWQSMREPASERASDFDFLSLFSVELQRAANEATRSLGHFRILSLQISPKVN